MIRAAKWLGALLVVAMVAAGIWAWAPDIDAATLKARYGGPAARYVRIDNGAMIHVRDEGPRDAPAIVLLHGSNAALQTWDGWAARLAPGYRVIRIDQYGHGLTGPNPAGDYSTQAYVAALDAVAVQLGLHRFVLAGNSFGGSIAWRYTLAHPDKVRALVLVDAADAPDAQPTRLPIGFRLARLPMMRPILNYFTPRSLIATSLRQSVGDPRIVDDAMIDRYWELLRYPGNRSATAERFAQQRSTITPEQLDALRLPVLVMWGAKDQLIPLRAGRWFASSIAGARLIVYPELGHIPMEEDPDRTARDLAGWLAQLDK